MVKHLSIVLLTAVLFLAGCGQPSPPDAGGDQRRTVTLGRTDSGRTVTVRVGDKLVLSLGATAASEGWRLALYPKKSLSLNGPSSGERLVLKAEHQGNGRVVAVDPSQLSGVCGRLKLGAKPPTQCPVLTAASQGGVPPRRGVFGLMVVVR